MTNKLGKEDKKTIIIDCAVDISDNMIDIKDFTDKFIKWIESNNWSFGGIIKCGEAEEETEKEIFAVSSECAPQAHDKPWRKRRQAEQKRTLCRSLRSMF